MNDFYTFGVRTLAPCDGEVIATKDGFPNRVPLDPDTENPYGNHVVLGNSGSTLEPHLHCHAV